MQTLCPHCSQHMVSVGIQGLTGTVPFGDQWNCIALKCPGCFKVLSVQIDPVAIKTDIVEEIWARINRKP